MAVLTFAVLTQLMTLVDIESIVDRKEHQL